MATTARLGVDIVAADKSRAAFDAFSRSLRQAQAEQRRFGAVANEAFLGFGRGLRSAAAAMGVTFGVGALAAFAKSAVTDLAAIKDQAERAGLAISDMQSLTFVARQGGGEQGDIVDIFQKMNKALGEAKQGHGDLGAILAANNIKLTDAAGHARDNKEIFLDIVDLVRGAGDEIDRARILHAAFSRSAQDALPFLKDGADAIRAGEDAARDVGAVIDEDIVKKAAVFDDVWTAAWDGWMALAKANIVSVGSVMADMIRGHKLQDFTPAESAANQLEELQFARDEVNRARAELEREKLIGSSDARIALSAGNLDEALAFLKAVQQNMTGGLFGDKGQGRIGGFGFTTKMPEKPEKPEKPVTSRTASTAAIVAERDAADELIERLEYERALIGMTDAERAVATNLRAAGADATAEQTAEIERLTNAMTAEVEAQKSLEAATAAANKFGRSIASALEDGVTNLITGADNLKGAIGSVLQQLERLALSKGFEALLGAGGPLGAGGLGGIFSSIFGGGFGGLRAEGGPVSAGRSYLVGERGPELFTPSGSGQITPNGMGGSTVINVHISTPSPEAFRKSQGQIRQQLASAVAAGQRYA